MNVPASSRFNALYVWLSACLFGHLREQPLNLSPVSGDAGFRNYYRVEGVSTPFLGADASPLTENNQAFCHVAKLFRQYGIHAPQVYAADFEQGFLLIEDLGAELYSGLLQDKNSALSLYADAEQCLLRMAAIPTQEVGLPAYDQVKLQQELDLFPQWFVEDLLQIKLDENAKQLIDRINQKLIANALEQPQVVVHRDFHCRNLLKISNNNPGVIDFQDAVVGPITYDLVSLYRDCYKSWPLEDIQGWVRNYYFQQIDAGLLQNIDEATYLRWFDWMGLQRHIKVLGIFARLFLRDGKSGYLKDLPLVISYVLSVAKQYEQDEVFAQFSSWFEKEILPSAKKHEWYREVVL